MTEQECIEVFKELLDVPCEMLIEYDSVTTEEQKKALVKIRVAEDMAIKALEKQIAKKPKGVDRDICPNCGTFNSIIQKRRNAVGSDTIYCWHCGTAIECEV